MEFVRERELVHLRYELRQLLADGRRKEAAPLLERLRQIAGQDADADGQGGLPLTSELARWSSSFDL